MYPAATMETGDSSLENLYYSKLGDTRSTLPAGYPTDTTTNPNNFVIKVSGATGQSKIGPGITLKVMAGDQFSVRATSWYKTNGASPSSPVNPLTDLVTALISGIGGLPGTSHLSQTILQNNSTVLSGNITQFLSDTGTAITETTPRAFVNWVLFDNQMNYVSSSSGFDQVGDDQEFKYHILTNLPIDKSGYLYIYVSNETPNIDVFFDNLQVTHVRGPMLEEDHYYPFGLSMSGISDRALKSNYAENKERSNGGSELQNKEFSDGSGLEAYDASFRMYDPQIGRFWQIDPLCEWGESWSPYSFSLDNPISFNDPLGLTDSIPVLEPVQVDPGQNKPLHIGRLTPVVDPTIEAPPPGQAPNYPTNIPGTDTPPAPSGDPEPDIPPPAVFTLPKVGLTAILTLIPKGGPYFPNGDETFFEKHPDFSPKALRPVVGNKRLDDVYLVRLGNGPESKEKLGTDAADAQNKGFPHGVSTMMRGKAPPYGKSAKVLDVMRRFLVQKTGNRPDHFTVVLPNPVTQQVADDFNSLFTK